MRVYKDKQFIVFEFENGKSVKYNLSNGETIGKNNRVVKSLNTQLRGYTIQNIIDSIENENYRNFITYVNKEVNRSQAQDYRGCRCGNGLVSRISNVGSLLSKVNNYSQYEQYFACGLTNVDLDTRSPYRVRCSINEIPKGLIKLCRQHNIKLDSIVLEAYNKIPNLYTVLLDMKFNTITSNEIQELLAVIGKLNHWEEGHNRYGGWREADGLYNHTRYIVIKYLTENYNYNIKSLLVYLDNLMTYEAIEDFANLCTEFYDYVNMANKISNKFEKYPRYFLSTHRITCRNYERLKEIFVERDFIKRIDKDLEWSTKDYNFIYPKSTQDIKDEAVQQANCVASYIQKVIDGECHIIFLRKQNKDKPKDEQYNQSLITLEIRDYKVVQARGKFNRVLYTDEQQLVDMYNNYLLKIKNKKENMKECVA